MFYILYICTVSVFLIEHAIDIQIRKLLTCKLVKLLTLFYQQYLSMMLKKDKLQYMYFVSAKKKDIFPTIKSSCINRVFFNNLFQNMAQ